MKKLLLLASVTALSCSSMSAFEAAEYNNAGFCGFSPNGKMTASYLYGNLTIIDLENNNEYVYDDESGFATGAGNFISNNGVVVGQANDFVAQWWKDGQWHEFDGDASRMSIAYGITPDGSRIVGGIAPEGYAGDYDGLMLTPCYWDVKEDGTFGAYTSLPFPSKDLTGRTPQYVTAVSVSADGKTIAGQIVDFGGGIIQPILYTQDESGEWSYVLVQNELYHPEGFVMPEDPGEAPNIQAETFMSAEELAAYEAALEEYNRIQDSLFYPEATQFMSDEEFEAYLAALDAFYASWETGEYAEYPAEEDYMTEEEMAAYLAAVDAYYEAVNSNVYPEYKDYMTEEEWALYQEARKVGEEWDERWIEFAQAYEELSELVPSLTFNNVILSADGKKYLSSVNKEYMDWDMWMFVTTHYPICFNLQDETYTVYDNDIDLVASSMTDDGTILAQNPPSMLRPAAEAYILPAGTDQFVTLYDYCVENDAELAAWMKKNLTRTYIVYDYVYDENLDDWVEVQTTLENMPTGIPFTNSDLSIVSLTIENFWDYDETGIAAYGYLLVPDFAGVTVAENDKNISVESLPGAVLSFNGEFESADVYELSGRKVFSVSKPAGHVATGLAQGVYVVRAALTDGTVKAVKVAF